MCIRAISRGLSESEKLKRLAEREWAIDHVASDSFQYNQLGHRFEVIFTPENADALDIIKERCRPLSECAKITVGIQVYHKSRVSTDIIKHKSFHSGIKKGNDWYKLYESNTIQRYHIGAGSEEWLKYSNLLHDKRPLPHYGEPRILIQQIFWKRLSAVLQEPNEPEMYLNTLFAVYEPDGISLPCLLGFINSRFVSATYERWANKLLGDKFPKVSKADLACIPIPHVSDRVDKKIGNYATELQALWSRMREGFTSASSKFVLLGPTASLAEHDGFWYLKKDDFIRLVAKKYKDMPIEGAKIASDVYTEAKKAINENWHLILKTEDALETAIKDAYGLSDDVYKKLVAGSPEPSIAWALNAMRS